MRLELIILLLSYFGGTIACTAADEKLSPMDTASISSVRIQIEGNDMEALYDEMSREAFRQRILKLSGIDPEKHSHHSWKIFGGRSTFIVDVSAFDGALGTDTLRENLERYVRCRRQGLTPEFIFPRLSPVSVPDKTSGAMKRVLASARKLLPGIREADFNPVNRILLSFPRLNSRERRYVFFKDRVVAHLFELPPEDDLERAPWDCWISSLDIEIQDNPGLRDIIRSAERRVAKESKAQRKNGDSMASYWIAIYGELVRKGISGWLSPQILNPLSQFD